MTIEAITNIGDFNQEILEMIETMSPQSDIFSIIAEDQLIQEESNL